MPNHYTNIVLMYPGPADDEDEYLLVKNLKTWHSEKPFPMQRVYPMPEGLVGSNSPFRGTQAEEARLMGLYGATNWYDWKIKNWGTKWGVYDVKVIELPGDGTPIMLTFSTAWCPPNGRMVDLMSKELMEMGAESVTWAGMNPGDCRVRTENQRWAPKLIGLQGGAG